MENKFVKWLRKHYNKIVNSIAFYPAIIVICFLILSVLMLMFDFSSFGENLKGNVSWISLRDPDTARSMISSILGGLISLTVFSFSMVMILLNQAASQISNRMLENMISDRFQQFVLGFYIGSIVYSLSLLSTIRNIKSGIYVPSLSIYLLLLITVADIFIFIYFLHYVTQSIKYETLISRVHRETLNALKDSCTDEAPSAFILPAWQRETIYMEDSGYFQRFNKEELIKLCAEQDVVIHLLHPKGSYLLKGIPLLHMYSRNKITEENKKKILMGFDFYTGQEVSQNYYYGFHQLAEVAIKSCSPGINDPETAVLSMHALTDLFAFRINHFIQTKFEDKNGIVRLQTMDWSFEKLFEECFYAIWKYGKHDHYIQEALLKMIGQLKVLDIKNQHSALFTIFLNAVNEQISTNQFYK